MMTVLMAFLIFALVVSLMSLGVILSGRRIQGSCGGLSNIPGIESDCEGACRRSGEAQGAACHLDSRGDAPGGRQRCAHHGRKPVSVSPGARSA